MQYRKPDPCHSEARFTGEESASCPQQNSRFLAQNAALWNDNSFGLFRSHESARWQPHNRDEQGVQSSNPTRTRGKALEFLREPSPVVSA